MSGTAMGYGVLPVFLESGQTPEHEEVGSGGGS